MISYLDLLFSFSSSSSLNTLHSSPTLYNHQQLEHICLFNMQFQSFPYLGTFARLPIEIRLMIWEYLFSTLHTQPPGDSLHKHNPHKHNLSIFCASQYLYNEVSSHLFHDSIQHISLNPEYNEEEWMAIQLKSRTVDIKWALRDRANAEKHFHSFPHSKTTMKIHINSPDPTDPGQMVLIWQKANALVDLLIGTTQSDIVVATNGEWHSAPPAHWQRDKDTFYEMGGLQETIKSSKYRPDSDIAILPFLRLELWVKDPIVNVPAMSDEVYAHLHRRLVSLFDQNGIERRLKKLLCMNQDIAVQQIESAIIDTNLFLETSLDELPGETASFLRLDRFKNWFENGTRWESRYETQLYNQLCACPWVVMDTDPWLHRSNQRYIILILLHHAMYAFQSSPSNGFGIYDKSRIYTRWNQALWSEIFDSGLPPLPDVQDWLSRFWSEAFQFRKVHAYTDWLYRRRVEETGVEECRCPLVHRLVLWGH